MDILSHILGVPGIARRQQQQQSEPEGEAQAQTVETQTDESSKPRNLFTAIRQKFLAIVGK
jgi:hypothetical protein